MKVLKAFVFGFVALGVCSAHALGISHSDVKAMLEKRFGLAHHEVGMASATIPSANCSIEILDSVVPTEDSAVLRVKQGESVVEFMIADSMSYDWSRDSFIDLTADRRSGLNTFATVLKISDSKLQIVHLNLYPNDPASTEKSVKLTCHL